MTEPFTLSDLDPLAGPEDVDDHNVTLHIEARFVDGSSQTFKLVDYDIWDADQILLDIANGDLTDRLNQLSPSQREEYDNWFEWEAGDTECTCKACCFCYDPPDLTLKGSRVDALYKWTKGGVRLTWCWQPFGVSGSQTIDARDTEDEYDEGLLNEVINVDGFVKDNGIEVSGYSDNEDRHTEVTETFTLADIDVAIDEIDPDDYFIEIREISTDGTSEIYVVHDPNDLEWFLADLKSGQDGTRRSGLTPEQVERYHRFEEETECRCDGSCDSICWYDLSEQEQWLDEVAPSGVDIEWVWMFNEKTRGPEGSGLLTAFNTVIDEGPGLAGEFWRQVEWD